MPMERIAEDDETKDAVHVLSAPETEHAEAKETFWLLVATRR